MNAADLRWEAACYAVLCVALWPWPLLGLLHAESAAVVAFAAFFVAGLSALRRFGRGAAFGRVFAGQEAALVVPWALLTCSLLWRPNCGYAQGLLLYLLFPPASVAAAVAAAYALSGARGHFQKTLFCAGGVLVAALGPLYDLGLHPQFYTYNHVFGGVLGPIYDEELALRPGLFAFRGLTLLWAFLLYLIGRRLHEKSPFAVRHSLFATATAVLIGLCYLFSARLGINTPAWYLQEQLGDHVRTEHFDIYLDAEAMAARGVREGDLKALVDDHEYRYAWLAERLGAEPSQRVASYLYPDEDAKARLTGARRVSVAPVWLPRPQTHLLAGAYGRSFGHELAHAFSRAFGLPVLNASVSVGLVEGLAVALEPPDGRPSPHEQVAVDALTRETDLAAAVAARLSPQGFWGGRGAVSYTTMGSFVRFLLDEYGAARLRQVYARADFEAVYGRPVRALAEEWERFLAGLPLVSIDTEALVTRRFAVPSLFEKACPHYVPPHRRAYRVGQEALAAGDTAAALGQWTSALRQRPGFVEARVARARLRLPRAGPAAVVQELDTIRAARRTPAVEVVLGDAYALLGEGAQARERYAAAEQSLPHYAESVIAKINLRLGVAGRPEVMRALTAPDSAAAQAARLARIQPQGALVALLRAARLMEAGRYEQALALLRSTPVPADAELPAPLQAMLRRQRLVWLARCAYRSGAPAQAAAYAEQSAQAYVRIGALGEAAHLQDVAAKMRWIAQRPPSFPDAPSGRTSSVFPR